MVHTMIVPFLLNTKKDLFRVPLMISMDMIKKSLGIVICTYINSLCISFITLQLQLKLTNRIFQLTNSAGELVENVEVEEFSYVRM